jgi:hypothetical protein
MSGAYETVYSESSGLGLRELQTSDGTSATGPTPATDRCPPYCSPGGWQRVFVPENVGVGWRGFESQAHAVVKVRRRIYIP